MADKLPMPPTDMQKSLDATWPYIVKKMDKGVREELSMKINPQEHERFLMEFCKEYEKRYGLPFQIVMSEEKFFVENDFSDMDEIKYTEPAQKKNIIIVRNENNSGLRRSKSPAVPKHERKHKTVPDNLGTAAAMYYRRIELCKDADNDPRINQENRLKRFIGRPVFYKDGLYSVIETGHENVLFIDRPTQWSDVTAVKLEDVLLKDRL